LPPYTPLAAASRNSRAERLLTPTCREWSLIPVSRFRMRFLFYLLVIAAVVVAGLISLGVI
jgi:hypothetical protein